MNAFKRMMEAQKTHAKRQRTGYKCSSCRKNFGNKGALQTHMKNCVAPKFGKVKPLPEHVVPKEPDSNSPKSQTNETSSSSSAPKKRGRTAEKVSSAVRSSPPKRKKRKKSRKRYSNIRKLELLLAYDEYKRENKDFDEFEDEFGVPFNTVRKFKGKEGDIRRDASDANPKVSLKFNNV